MKKLGSQLVLGILVTTLSVLATLANYVGTSFSGKSSGHSSAARQHLADANREEGLAMQLVILDATTFDNFYVYTGRDEELANYYYENFSPALRASVERDAPFDDDYYDEMYGQADELLKKADEEFANADDYSLLAGALRLLTLISAIGLSFAAYASLLEEGNQLRSIFALFATIALGLIVLQFLFVLLP